MAKNQHEQQRKHDQSMTHAFLLVTQHC